MSLNHGNHRIASGDVRIWFAIAVRTVPGWMENAAMPCDSDSSASTSVNRMSAHLLATYDDIYGIGRVPAPLATLMILPRLRSTMPGRIARQHRNGPRTFTSKLFHH